MRGARDDRRVEILDERALERVDRQALVNKTLVEMSKKLDLPLIATNDSHYMKQSDAEWHDILLCVQTGSLVSDERRYRFQGNDYYFRSPEEMWAIFGNDLRSR